VPHVPPDFLWSLLALANFMRLSLLKAAHAGVGWSRVQEIRVASAYSGFPVELAGVGALHAAFLDESRTRGCWWRPVQEIRIRGPNKTGEAHQSFCNSIS
jgi:hypothetical protein